MLFESLPVETKRQIWNFSIGFYTGLLFAYCIYLFYHFKLL